MRLYSVAVTSLVVGAPVKWTDNVISQFRLPEVRSRRRGVARGVSWAGVVRIALVRALHLELGCGVREAVALSGALLSGARGGLSVGTHLVLGFDREGLERDLQQRLAETLESAPRPRRGRPARRDRERRLDDQG